MTARAHSRAGFMLTETLAVLTISAFLLAGLVTLTSGMLRNLDGSIARMQAGDDFARAMDAIARDIRSQARARWAGIEPQNFILAGDSDELLFPHAEIGTDGLKHIIAIRLRLTHGGTVVTRADAPLGFAASKRSDLHFGAARELYRGLARLRFTYWAPLQGQSDARKVTSWKEGQNLPAAISLEARDPSDGRLLFAQRIAITANADPGCLDGSFCGRLDKVQAQAPVGIASAPGPLPPPPGAH